MGAGEVAGLAAGFVLILTPNRLFAALEARLEILGLAEAEILLWTFVLKFHLQM